MSASRISVIVTGATGMVGEGVLHECIHDERVERILIVGRKPSGNTHPKVAEAVVPDLSDVTSLRERLAGYDACLFCMGVSSIGMKEDKYAALTYDLTLRFAATLKELNPGMSFCYISGSGTDSSAKGRSMWARVKGRTENALLDMFQRSYMFRPGYMQPTRGLKNTLGFYRFVAWMYPLMRLLGPGFIGTLRELGRAMIEVSVTGYEKRVLEVKDIRIVSSRKKKL